MDRTILSSSAVFEVGVLEAKREQSLWIKKVIKEHLKDMHTVFEFDDWLAVDEDIDEHISLFFSIWPELLEAWLALAGSELPWKRISFDTS